METINYIKHLNGVFQQFSKDSRLNPTHISLYMALFQYWNLGRFPVLFFINREDIMHLSKIGSKATYHRCLRALDDWKYISYLPSHNPYKGSRIKMLIFGTTPEQVLNEYKTSTEQALVPINKHLQTIENNINITKLDQPKNENEVIDFFKKENWASKEALKFFNHYQGIGWKVGGKTKIVDWQATARNWMLKADEIRNYKQQSHFKDNISLPPSGELKEEDNLKTAKNKNYDEPL